MFNPKTLLLFVAIFTTFSCSDTSTKLSPLSVDAKILAFGDSLTYGTGAGNEQDYPTLLAKMTNLTIINEGIPGEISNKGLERLPALLEIHHTDLLILIHGGNDILRKRSRNELKQNILNMIVESQQRNIEVVLLGVPEPGIFLKSAKVYEELADETKIPAELKLLANILGDRSLKSDAAHPNAEGYQVLAQGIFKFLKDHGALN